MNNDNNNQNNNQDNIVDNNTNMHRVYMPVRYENGTPVPDFALNTAIEEFQAELRKKNVTDPGLINTKLQEMLFAK